MNSPRRARTGPLWPGALGCLSVALVGCFRYDVPTDDSGLYADCCEGRATCLPKALLPGQAQFLGQAECAPELLCVPDALAADPGYQPARCTSILELEGRCASDCLPAVAEQLSVLPQADCGEHERCVPCVDPVLMEPTGVCELGAGEAP